ncbi:MAG: S-adenosylmethionine hydrolase [Candidatus Poriferisodalaceae bacterium]|jgi:S-adenosylmethionine hydrolase
MSRFNTITFLSDFGTADESTGVCRSILRELSPDTVVVDLAHELPLGDVRLASLMLARSVPYLAPGIVLASVGRSMDRPCIAVEVGEGQAYLVGPDNGLLAAAVAVVGGAGRAVRLTSDDHQLASPGSVHEGRDILTPAAGHLAAGVPMEELGEMVEPAGLVPSLMPVPRIDDNGAIVAEVLFVDRRGSAQLNIDREALEDFGEVVVLAFRDERRVVKVIPEGHTVATGQYGLAEDVHGLLSVVAGSGSAAADLRMEIGTEVIVTEAT